MDRQTVYLGQTPLETDLLNTNRNTMVALAGLSSALFGTTMTATGLACSPTSPATLRVQIGPGHLYSVQNLDSTAYSSLAADTTHQIVKQGISLDAVILNTPAPTTAGYSINYLIEASYAEVDANPVVLPYYNSANPPTAFSGPANSGVAQPTARKGTVVLTAKPGIAATTGTQTTPAADAGSLGLWVVTVAYGATTVVIGNIAAYPGASAVPAGGIVRAVQSSAFIYAVAGGTGNILTAALSPAPIAITPGMEIIVKAAATNTGAATLSLNGAAAAAITLNGNALPGGALSTGQLYAMIFDGTTWQVQNANLTGIYLYADRTTAGTDSVAVPGWATHAEVQVIGGGGAGGGAGTGYSGGGGGAGGYSFGVVAVTPGATLTRVVGAGGVGGTGVGGDGGISSLSGIGSATGGSGGSASAGNSAGGNGGSGSGAGLRNFSGTLGADGFPQLSERGGQGGAGPFGGGGRSGAGGGLAGAAAGSGGGGAYNSASNGGAGADGAVLIRFTA